MTPDPCGAGPARSQCASPANAQAILPRFIRENVDMRAITIKQPHAWAVLTPGLKPYENRTWPTSYTGIVLIHSGKSIEPGRHYPDQPAHLELVTGVVLGIVDLVGCRRDPVGRQARILEPA